MDKTLERVEVLAECKAQGPQTTRYKERSTQEVGYRAHKLIHTGGKTNICHLRVLGPSCLERKRQIPLSCMVCDYTNNNTIAICDQQIICYLVIIEQLRKYKLKLKMNHG